MTFDEFVSSVSVFNTKLDNFNTKNFGLQLACLVEELGELAEAINKDRTIEYTQDEWADVLYVLVGLPVVMGWEWHDVKDALRRVAAKNSEKLHKKLEYSSTGKLLK